jgi:hypothetical protein
MSSSATDVSAACRRERCRSSSDAVGVIRPSQCVVANSHAPMTHRTSLPCSNDAQHIRYRPAVTKTIYGTDQQYAHLPGRSGSTAAHGVALAARAACALARAAAHARARALARPRKAVHAAQLCSQAVLAAGRGAGPRGGVGRGRGAAAVVANDVGEQPRQLRLRGSDGRDGGCQAVCQMDVADTKNAMPGKAPCMGTRCGGPVAQQEESLSTCLQARQDVADARIRWRARCMGGTPGRDGLKCEGPKAFKQPVAGVLGAPVSPSSTRHARQRMRARDSAGGALGPAAARGDSSAMSDRIPLAARTACKRLGLGVWRWRLVAVGIVGLESAGAEPRERAAAAAGPHGRIPQGWAPAGSAHASPQLYLTRGSVAGLQSRWQPGCRRPYVSRRQRASLAQPSSTRASKARAEAVTVAVRVPGSGYGPSQRRSGGGAALARACARCGSGSPGSKPAAGTCSSARGGGGGGGPGQGRGCCAVRGGRGRRGGGVGAVQQRCYGGRRRHAAAQGAQGFRDVLRGIGSKARGTKT